MTTKICLGPMKLLVQKFWALKNDGSEKKFVSGKNLSLKKIGLKTFWTVKIMTILMKFKNRGKY